MPEKLGIVIKYNKTSVSNSPYEIHNYETHIGTKPKDKSVFFITTPAIQEVIEKNNLEKERIGNISFSLMFDGSKNAYMDYIPFGMKKPEIFMGRGIGALLEIIVLNDLRKKGFGDFQIKHRINPKRKKERERQLEKIYGREFCEIQIEKPTIEQAYWARRRFIEKERREQQKPPFWKRTINKLRETFRKRAR